MRLRSIYLVLFFFLWGCKTNISDGNGPYELTISGTVVSKISGESLENVQVTISQFGQIEADTVLTDSLGGFMFTDFLASQEDEIMINFNSVGYAETSAVFVVTDKVNYQIPEPIQLFVAANFPCIDNVSSSVYPCDDINLYSHLTPEELGGSRLNDIWGWTDPLTNKEYALVGLTDGVSFVDISNPNSPVVVGKLLESDLNAKFKIADFDQAYPACTIGIGETEAAKALAEGSTWRDMKVFGNHMFVVSDAQAHGMQVFDLTKLRSYSGEFVTFTHDVLYDKFANAHNIVINEETGFAYAAGVTSAEMCGSRQETGLHIIDINNPTQPAFAGCFFDAQTEIDNGFSAGVGYIHDAQCVIYDGPDSDHRGKELCFSSAEGALVISDVTDKNSPLTIGFSGASQMQYSHQGWLTEDHEYFLMNDELDERNLGRNTKTYIWNVKDLENPTFVGHYTHSTSSIDHNLYTKDNRVFQANYNAGLRVYNIGDLSNLELTPIGYFDTQPSSDAVGFDGTWSNYPFFESGIVIVSDIEDGLFVLRTNFKEHLNLNPSF